MRFINLTLIGWFLLGTTPILRAVEPVPEAQQAALALKIINAYQGTKPASPPKKLHVVYYTPADRDPEPRYQERLEAIMEDIRSFYRDGMQSNGFGPETFDLDRDANGKWIIYFVKGKAAEASYQSWKERPGTGALDSGDKVMKECRPVLEAAGIWPGRETVLIFCNLANWDAQAKTFRHHSPYYGEIGQTNGLCFAVDSVILDVANIPKKEPILDDQEYGKMSLGKFNSIFIGGIAHELGHAFSLQHCGERWDEKPLGISIMGAGNHYYRDERRGEKPGAFLTMGSAMKLAGRPLFNHSDKGLTQPPQANRDEFQISTNITRPELIGRKGAVRIDGIIKGTPPVYGVIAYFDSVHDGGYYAPTATAVPDANGRYAIEISDLKSDPNVDLRLEYCFANGWSGSDEAQFRIRPDGSVDLSQWELRKALKPVADAVAQNQLGVAAQALELLQKENAPEPAITIATKLVTTLDGTSKPSPAEVPETTKEFALGDAKPESAKVGYFVPAQNRIPANDQVKSPLLDTGKLYATGLFAHAPSRYVFDLGGKWKTLKGQGGLHIAQQPFGTVVFIIKADGKEIYRSGFIRHANQADYDLDVTGVKTLELIVGDAGDGNGNDWALWLEPTLSR